MREDPAKIANEPFVTVSSNPRVQLAKRYCDVITDMDSYTRHLNCQYRAPRGNKVVTRNTMVSSSGSGAASEVKW